MALGAAPVVVVQAGVGMLVNLYVEDVPSSVELRWRPSDVQAASSLL
jgi:hypothetical protein